MNVGSEWSQKCVTPDYQPFAKANTV